MYDDGQHNDGIAGDSTYGVSINISVGDINYYIYAENSQSASFLPVRAEKEFFTIPVVGGVVINEMLAINNSAIQDQNGQYDDCIELYNNYSSSISLDGFLLSNDSTNLTKWQFPDISIPTHSYLIVWADNDLNQAGLHANFKLDGANGTLILCNDDGIKIDRVVYGPQTADISYGRYPNGSGQLILMSPSFGFSNNNGLDICEKSQITGVRLLHSAYPNPFNRITTVKYNLPVQGKVLLQVFDVTGRQVTTLIDSEQNAGTYSFNFINERNRLSTGIYFARLIINTVSKRRLVENVKLIMTK
jgi:hypothetical protein